MPGKHEAEIKTSWIQLHSRNICLNIFLDIYTNAYKPAAFPCIKQDRPIDFELKILKFESHHHNSIHCIIILVYNLLKKSCRDMFIENLPHRWSPFRSSSLKVRISDGTTLSSQKNGVVVFMHLPRHCLMQVGDAVIIIL